MRRLLSNEPAVTGSAVVAVLNGLALLHVVALDGMQVAGINTALVAVLGLFVRSRVSPTATQ